VVGLTLAAQEEAHPAEDLLPLRQQEEHVAQAIIAIVQGM
jgi:hypothetical protein